MDKPCFTIPRRQILISINFYRNGFNQLFITQPYLNKIDGCWQLISSR